MTCQGHQAGCDLTSNATTFHREHSRALALSINGHRPASSLCPSRRGVWLPQRDNKSETASINQGTGLDMNG